MRRPTSTQAGFTLLELTGALMIISTLAVILGSAAFDRIQEARIDSSIAEARTVVRACEIARRKVLSTLVVGGITTHTYPTMAAWSSTATLQSKLSVAHKLPATNDLGTAVLVKFDSARCYVAVDLPFLQDGYGGFETETVGGKTRVIVTIPRRIATQANWVTQQKQFLHLEDTR